MIRNHVADGRLLQVGSTYIYIYISIYFNLSRCGKWPNPLLMDYCTGLYYLVACIILYPLWACRAQDMKVNTDSGCKATSLGIFRWNFKGTFPRHITHQFVCTPGNAIVFLFDGLVMFLEKKKNLRQWSWISWKNAMPTVPLDEFHLANKNHPPKRCDLSCLYSLLTNSFLAGKGKID